MSHPEKLFTKSAFKIALSCPNKIYYARNPKEYENVDQEDSFLQSLAEGGFQVGELAKFYCGVPSENDLAPLKGYEDSLARTQELMKQENVNIAEAAFRFGNLFVRVDILQKQGTHIRLIEVKAKSWNPETDAFIGKDGRGKDEPVNTVKSGIREYVYDVAFQKYVVEQSLNELYPDQDFDVEAKLMMADKTKCADFNGMNQLFKIVSDAKGRSGVMVQPEAIQKLAASKVQVLTAFDVNEVCDRIIAGTTTEQAAVFDGMQFLPFIQKASDCYCNNYPWPEKPHLGGKCFGCPYKVHSHPEMKDGQKSCWTQYMTVTDYETRPKIKELNGAALGAKRSQWVAEGTYFLDQITTDMLPQNCGKDHDGLDHLERKWLQIGLATNNQSILKDYAEELEGHTFIATDELRREMSRWKYPLHMIDFETTAVALPYYVGMKPYEQVAFQFSHHIIYEDGRIEHAGQYLNEHVDQFPNFEFVRKLKNELSKDDGTIFRYANHENTILQTIAEQLRDSQEPDRNELIAWINTISHNSNSVYRPERDMVDLLEVVKRYYYQYDEMKGSNSIKQVLPAVLNSSKNLQQRYGQPVDGSLPIYGRIIPSLNIKSESPVAWIQYLEDGRVDSPYHQLPPIGDLIQLSEDEQEYLDMQEASEEDAFTVANGGAALTAYSKLMFCSGQQMTDALRLALLRYCELDTLAMVFIWEYFMEKTRE